MIKHRVVLWSDVNEEAIKQIIEEDTYLPVIAACEINNAVDNKAVMILLNTKILIKAISKTPANLDNSVGITASGYVRLGYLRRENQKDEIFNFIDKLKGRKIEGYLTKSLDGIHFETEDDDDIPF